MLFTGSYNIINNNFAILLFGICSMWIVSTSALEFSFINKLCSFSTVLAVFDEVAQFSGKP